MSFLKNRQGVSILEVILSLALVLIIIGIFSGSMATLRLQKVSTGRALAITFVQSELEALIEFDYADLIDRASGDFIGFAYNLGVQTVQADASAQSSPNVLDVQAATNTFINNVSSVVLLPEEYFDDVTMGASVKVLSTSGVSWEVGLIVRYIDPDNYYYYSLSSSSLDFVKVIDGIEESLYSSAGSYSLDTWYDLEITSAGTSIQLRLNSALQTTINDAYLLTGSMGLMGRDSTNYLVDDFALTSSVKNVTSNFDSELEKHFPLEFSQLAPQELIDWQANLVIGDYNSLVGIKEITASLTWKSGDMTDSIQLTTLRSAI